MKKLDFVLVANIALAQKLYKRAAIQTNGESSTDKMLEAEENKLNQGGSPAAATEQTGQANAATFSVKENTKKPSALNGNKVPDNDNLSPRKFPQKTAGLSDLLSQSVSSILSKEAAQKCKCGTSYKGDKCPECGMTKEAAAGIAGEGDKELEKESDKLNLGGAPEGDVENASVSAENPDPVAHGGGKTPGEENENLSPRQHTQKTASENKADLVQFLKANPAVLQAQ